VDLTEHQTAHEDLFKGRLLHAFRDTVRMPDGSSSVREYIRHPGAVVIIPLVTRQDGTPGVILERQYRYPVAQRIIEFPAGKRNPGEESLVTARRELREETGYSARDWARAGTLHPAAAYSSEAIDIWFARNLRPGGRKLDPGEYLEVFEASADELLGWCRNGRVTDAKTLAGALWLQNILSGAWNLTWDAVPTEPHG
jgi:ADP-ribose pyrophosphatase